MLVHRIVYNFINQMIQAFPRGTSDIHTRALTHCFETFQHGNTAGIIRFFFGITVLSSLMCYCLFLLKILLSVPFWGTVFYYIIFLPGIARFSLEERISSVHQLLKRSHVAVCSCSIFARFPSPLLSYTPTAANPPILAPRIPARISSYTTHVSGGRDSFSAAFS